MKKLFLLFRLPYLQAILLIFCCIFASCQSKETDKTNQNKVDKSVEDSLKNLREKMDTNNQKTDKTDNNSNNNSNNNLADKSAEKKPQKLDSSAIIAKITKKWEITGNYWVSSIETFNNEENYFLDIKKDGSYTLKARLEDININETGKWQLQNPKLKFRKFEETDPKDNGVPIEDNEEILVLMPQNGNNKERLFLFNFEEKAFAFNALTRPSGLFAK